MSDNANPSCTAVKTLTVGASTTVSINETITNTRCGLNNGAIALTVSGGTSTYSYVWTGRTAGSNPTNVASGTYTVTVSDNANPSCTAVKTLTVGASTAVGINETITNTVWIKQWGIASTVSGGTSPYSYVWTGRIAGSNPTNVGVGTYTVTVSDNANPFCTVKTLTVGQAAVEINEQYTVWIKQWGYSPDS
ncbi:MAG: hypothetical protein IPJ13_24215 [Saprospiraceae bacterium]|nr:hypothetical protein [Saprospiraceae bacterium]